MQPDRGSDHLELAEWGWKQSFKLGSVVPLFKFWLFFWFLLNLLYSLQVSQRYYIQVCFSTLVPEISGYLLNFISAFFQSLHRLWLQGLKEQ